MVHQWRRVVFISLALIFLLSGYTLSQQVLVSRQERLALLQLRSSLGLRSKEWPIKSDPCTQWAGIECNNGRVTGINVSRFRRTRRGSQNPQFPVDALQNLTLLSSFNASNFALPGPIPDWLGLRLASLRELDLSSCLINGSIPFTLGNLSSLVALSLSGNNLAGTIPPNLGQLFWLSELDLSKNSLTGSIPDTFANLGNLTLFDTSLNSLSGAILPSIGTLSRLQFLNLSGNSFSSSIPAQLGDLTSLVDLDLGSNLLSGPVPADLRGLRNLQRIMIGNNFLSGSLPGNLFPPLARLQFVVLSNNGFSGDFPNVLWSISSLQFLDASVNNFTGALPDASSIADTSVAVFNISENLFYGNLTSIIRRFNFIDMSGNFFEGPVPVYARGNTSLTRNCLRNVTGQRNVTECASFYADRNLVFDNFGEPNITQPPLPPQSKKKSHKSVIIFASIFGGVGLMVLVVSIVVVLVICIRKRDTMNQRGIGVGPLPASESPPPQESLQSLDWITRLKIAIGAAEGLSYLHHECTPPLVHRDVQATSILLDDKFELRLGSLNEVCPQEAETHQNRISRLLRLPQASDIGASGTPNKSCAYDVYCFGKVLLELVTGKLGISSSTDTAPKEWLATTLAYINIQDKELVTNIVDQSLIIDEDLLEEVWAMAIVAKSCLNPRPNQRPLMRYVLKALENPLKVVREENTSSARLRTTSSRGSWNAALFGSWRHSSSDVAAMPAVTSNKVEGASSLKYSGITGSQGSDQNGDGNGCPSSTKRHS